ncbi:hypothetical protein CERSUDRAFT_87564 [Gelatoporia subvermispora B]|uniref:Uncharacterized protein n=1 Tax=Ceriporiopsis subvermispora (strain B) TaxID=914234 RepID=M2Q8R3_CERS8|nr:hypothetical protein CERSUDRAFT_87564 [Gelatoporia subvermispora B]
MAYDHEVAFENAEVCLLQAAEGKNGVGIFRPKDLRCRWSRECEQYRASFEVWVRIPSGAEENGPTVVKKFETDMSLFAHRLHQLEGKVFFDAINLQTSNSRIISESLGAGYATLRTSNGPISGTFNASHRLDLRTSNAPIDVDVQLLDAGDDDGTDLIMRTSNNHIEATTTLVSADVDRTNGTFSIDARTSNAHLSLAVPSAPVSHVLTLTARTSNARTSASLPSSWEGDFRLQTSLYTPTVNAHTEVPDPSGQDRRRSVAVHTVRKGTVDGRAAWVPTEERKTGVVNMRTSNAQLTLGL